MLHAPHITKLPRQAFACLIGVLVIFAVTASAASATTAYRGANVHDLEPWLVSSSQVTQDLSSLQNASANVLRVGVTWSALEPAKGQYSSSYLAGMDSFVAAAKQRGLHVIATVACTPTWASVGGQWNDAPSDPTDFGSIAKFITARYGTELAAVEAWNEPNWHNNLIATNVPATYAAMVKAFYTGAKQGNANVDVIVGATAYADISFFKALWSYGIKGYYDGLSIHPYADGADPADTTVTNSFINQLQGLHSAQQAIGDNTPIWATEFGWPTGAWTGATSEQLSATYLQKAFGILNGLSYVKGATAYQLRDMATDPTNPEDNFGLLRRDFTARPAYAKFTAAMHADAAGATVPTGHHHHRMIVNAGIAVVRKHTTPHHAKKHRHHARHHHARKHPSRSVHV